MLTSEKPLCFFVQLGGYQTHMVWMEKTVCDHPANARPLLPVSEVAALLGE